jgi:hypothetical protein
MPEFLPEETYYSDLSELIHDWSHSVYGEVTENIPLHAQEPLEKYVTLTHYIDVVTGWSITAIRDMVNKTPINLFSKKQATVETAPNGSESYALCICVEQIIDL